MQTIIRSSLRFLGKLRKLGKSPEGEQNTVEKSAPDTWVACEEQDTTLEMSQRPIQEAEERYSVEDKSKNLNTTPQCREIPSDQVRVRSVTDSGNDGRSWKHNGNTFQIGQTSDNALYFQGVQGEISATCLESNGNNLYIVDEMSGQAAGLQGFNSTQSIKEFLVRHRAQLGESHGSIRSGESETNKQNYTQNYGPGRVLGN